MRHYLVAFALLATSGRVLAGDFVIQTMSGEVSFRSGATVEWRQVHKGDILKPHDTMKTGEKGSAVLLVKGPDGVVSKRVSVPPQTIVDLADMRNLTTEDLLLSITMERVRQAPLTQPGSQPGQLPGTTVIHGGERVLHTERPPEDTGHAVMRMNGARVLFTHEYFSTCAIRAFDLMRWYPSLKQSFDHRLMLAESLERSDLNGEALIEYAAMQEMKDLSAQQRSLLDARIARLKRDS